ncbi:MAG TPA: exodeoxyribonuclease VII large subunit [Polyangia bacterium]|nr:exodeoxyribonuclease VII large subunit [Polyangia bacterium]
MRADASAPNEAENALTVAQVNRRARTLLEDRFAAVWIEAEVSETTRARSGHVYFTLADPDGKAQIGAVMWSGPALRYGSRISKGALLRCHGRVTVYEAQGRYQLSVDRVAEAGAGIRARKLAELRERLAAEGLFAPERKRPLPPVPRCVGVVTSRDGAAIRDIVEVVSRRFPVRLLLAHAQVQGAGAAASIATALALLARVPEVEVVIVGRGGGSAEDLDAFNAEEVVRAVAAHPVPVISAVGHEVDITLCDLAADRRAATPSEAGELAVPELEALAARLDDRRRALGNALGRQLGRSRERLAVASGRLGARDPRVRLRAGLDRLVRARVILARWPARVERSRAALRTIEASLRRWPGPALERSRGDLGRLAAELNALSPLGSLARGYAVARRLDDGRVLRRAAEAPAGTDIEVLLAQGRLECTVERITGDEEGDVDGLHAK